MTTIRFKLPDGMTPDGDDYSKCEFTAGPGIELHGDGTASVELSAEDEARFMELATGSRPEVSMAFRLGGVTSEEALHAIRFKGEPLSKKEGAKLHELLLARAADAPYLYQGPGVQVSSPSDRPYRHALTSELKLELRLRRGPDFRCQYCGAWLDPPRWENKCDICQVAGYLTGEFTTPDETTPQYLAWVARVVAQYRKPAGEGG